MVAHAVEADVILDRAGRLRRWKRPIPLGQRRRGRQGASNRGKHAERGSKMSRKRRYIDVAHPFCCFCGGTTPATTLDHVPSKSCFPDGLCPEGFEFPACKACNHGTKRDDQIFGSYVMLLDFDRSSLDQNFARKLIRLRDGIANNYPEALPDASTAHLICKIGGVDTPRPIAVAVRTRVAFRDAALRMGRKLAHALYYRELGKPLSKQHRLATGLYQAQDSRAAALTQFFANLLPDQTIASRANVRNYGQRFAYKSGVKDEGEFFVYAAQFGKGLIVWGIVLGPSFGLDVVPKPLSNMRWHNGASI